MTAQCEGHDGPYTDSARGSRDEELAIATGETVVFECENAREGGKACGAEGHGVTGGHGVG